MQDQLITQYEQTTKEMLAVQEQISQAVAEHQTKLATLQKQEAELKTAIKEAMEANNVKKFENDFIAITYVAPVERTIFDSTRFKKEQPETYDQYTKTSRVKSSVRIKVKDQE